MRWILLAMAWVWCINSLSNQSLVAFVTAAFLSIIAFVTADLYANWAARLNIEKMVREISEQRELRWVVALRKEFNSEDPQ